jgi:hypothetical protein
MNEISLLQTALLLGLYVALAGSYGLVYNCASSRAIDPSPDIFHCIRAAWSDCDRNNRLDTPAGRLEGADRREQRRISRDSADHLALSPTHS